jgi:hypothetical protein
MVAYRKTRTARAYFGLGKSTMRTLGIAALSAALVGCAASRQEAAARLGDQFMGQNVDVMVAQFGPPASTFKMSSGGASYQLAGGTDIVGGNGVGIASQRYCKVNVITDRSSTVVDLKTDDTGSATSYGYFTVTESLCAKRFGMKKET